MEYLEREGARLAYIHTPGQHPTLVFLPGFMSDMEGSKALAVEAYGQASGLGVLRLDYAGHGQSGGRFEDGTISRWRDDVLAVIDHCTVGPVLLIGSSMGGWLALLVALARPARVAGLQLIAPAPDFTRWSLEAKLTGAERSALATVGHVVQPSLYGPEGYIITRRLIEDGHRHCLMDAPIPLTCPVCILHGQQDPDVPWQRSLQLVERLASGNVHLTLIKDGDHRLSRPQDIAALLRAVESLRELTATS